MVRVCVLISHHKHNDSPTTPRLKIFLPWYHIKWKITKKWNSLSNFNLERKLERASNFWKSNKIENNSIKKREEDDREFSWLVSESEWWQLTRGTVRIRQESTSHVPAWELFSTTIDVLFFFSFLFTINFYNKIRNVYLRIKMLVC